MRTAGIPLAATAAASTSPQRETQAGAVELTECRFFGGRIAASRNWPGAEHTKSNAVSSPTESGLLSCPNSGHSRCATVSDGFGLGAPLRKDGGMTLLMCSTPSPPNALEQAAGGFCLATEPETMTSTATAAQRGAVSSSHSTATKTGPKSIGAPRRVRKAEPFFQLSCTNEIYRNGRRTYRGEWLQIPAEQYFEGRITGLKLAGEMLALLRSSRCVSHEVKMTLAEMLVRGAEKRALGKATCWAADAAADFLLNLLASAARHTDWEELLRRKVDHETLRELEWIGHHAERENAARQAFVQRMKAARAAKRAARQAEQAKQTEGGAA